MKLVFVHGAGESSVTFYYQLRHFRNSKGIDLPGHPHGMPCTSIAGYMEWVRGFIAARRYKDVLLCGHSMGGAIAMLYALKYPDELKGIILISSGARLRVDSRYLREAQEATTSPSQWLSTRQQYLSKVPQDVHQMLMRKAVEVGPLVQHNDFLCCDSFDIMDQVGSIRLPTQVICGTEDVMTPVKYSNYLVDRIPGACQVVVEQGTHYVQAEQAQRVNEAIETFMGRLK